MQSLQYLYVCVQVSCKQSLPYMYRSYPGRAMVVPCRSSRVGRSPAPDEAFMYAIANVRGGVALQCVVRGDSALLVSCFHCFCAWVALGVCGCRCSSLLSRIACAYVLRSF